MCLGACPGGWLWVRFIVAITVKERRVVLTVDPWGNLHRQQQV
jgi:hypothetical protein